MDYIKLANSRHTNRLLFHYLKRRLDSIRYMDVLTYAYTRTKEIQRILWLLILLTNVAAQGCIFICVIAYDKSIPDIFNGKSWSTLTMASQIGPIVGILCEFVSHFEEKGCQIRKERKELQQTIDIVLDNVHAGTCINNATRRIQTWFLWHFYHPSSHVCQRRLEREYAEWIDFTDHRKRKMCQ
jgi:hypothetical protein